MRKLLFSFIAAAALAALPLSGISTAAEHGGTPMGGQSTIEHPGKAAVTAEAVKKVIKEHVQTAESLNDGVFLIRDDKLNKEWRLKLDKIHDPVRQFEKNGQTIYFACSDFKALDSSDVLDIDFWMVGKGTKLEVIETRIHKVNGEPRFTYEGTEIKEVR
jgi:hypothetical protein